MKHENADGVFDAVTGFLNQCDAVEATAPEGTTSTGTGGDELLMASHQLLAETEELLSLYQPPVNKRNEEVADPSPKSIEEDKQIAVPKGKLSADQRRAIRNAQAAKRRQRYRQHLKEERASLKNQATQLSSQLQEMQEARAELKVRQVGNLAFGAWRALAVRQLEQRLQAEQRQKLLRAEVAGRARVIHQMNAFLQERLQNHESNPIISWELIKTNGEIAGSELFKSMMSDFDRQYAQTDEVFRDLKFKTSIPVVYDQTRKWQDGVLYFDSADRMDCPHDFEQAAEAISIVMMSDREDGLESIKIQDVKDTFTMKYRMTYQVSPGKHASFVIYGAAKRYREKDRLVFLWRCYTEGCDEFEGFHCDETLWLVVRPSAARRNSTVLECYSCLVPIRFGTTSKCDENMDNFVKVLAESSEEESNKMMQLLERLLISCWDSDSGDDRFSRRKKKPYAGDEEISKTASVSSLHASDSGVSKRSTTDAIDVTNDPPSHLGCRCVDCYARIGKIDEGTYGVVHKARDKETGDIVALKQVKMSADASQEGFSITALCETNVLLL